MTQSCKNCKYAEFHRTPTGRISNTRAGECKAPSPISTDIPHPSSMLIRVSRWHEVRRLETEMRLTART